MSSDRDIDDRKATTRLFLIIAAVIVALLVVLALIVAPVANEAFSPGLGLKGAAIVAFAVTLVVIVTLLIAAGDGIIGEIQYSLPAFLVFFLLIWVLVAWVF